MQRAIQIAFVVVTLAWLPDAAAQGSAAPGGGSVANASGFLRDYARLKPLPDQDRRFTWTAPEAELRRYTRFILPPMEVWIDRDATYRGLSADVVQRIAGIYQSSFTRVLAPEFATVTTPSPGVALCRFAITGATPEHPRFTPLDVVPIKAAFTLARAATGTSAQVARVSAEIECEDSVTKGLLLEAVITGVGDRKFIEGRPIPWADVEPVLASWAQDFKAQLVAAQGR